MEIKQERKKWDSILFKTTRNKIISNKTIKMKLSPIHYHFKISNEKLVLPLCFEKLGESSSQVNRPSKFGRKLNKFSYLELLKIILSAKCYKY